MELPDEVQFVSLLQLLSNPLILHSTIPYLPISSTLALAAASKSFSELIHHTQYVFRHLDLRNVKRAQPVNFGRIDNGGQVFRTRRCDEGVTEEDFYSGPLRGIFASLRQRNIMKDVQTLILDGLSVPAPILREIIIGESFNVRLLSIRDAKNLDERELIQILRDAVSTPENTARLKLKGLYVFGPRDPSSSRPEQSSSAVDCGMRMSVAASIGSSWNRKSTEHLSQSLYGTSDRWYCKSGKMINKLPLSDWGSVLVECKDFISFDAPLCAGPRHSSPKKANDGKIDSTSWYRREEFHLPPNVATFALEGCYSCGKAPEGLAKFGKFPMDRFPLLSPVPVHSSTIKAAKCPETSSNASTSAQPQILARCQECLRNRYCENCHKWWCEDCYDVSSHGHNLHPISMMSSQQPLIAIGSLREKSTDLESNDVKGVSRECWDCGLNCLDCSLVTQQRCKICGGGYCLLHNEGSTYTTCDWCSTGVHRHRELY